MEHVRSWTIPASFHHTNHGAFCAQDQKRPRNWPKRPEQDQVVGLVFGKEPVNFHSVYYCLWLYCNYNSQKDQKDQICTDTRPLFFFFSALTQTQQNPNELQAVMKSKVTSFYSTILYSFIICLSCLENALVWTLRNDRSQDGKIFSEQCILIHSLLSLSISPFRHMKLSASKCRIYGLSRAFCVPFMLCDFIPGLALCWPQNLKNPTKPQQPIPFLLIWEWTVFAFIVWGLNVDMLLIYVLYRSPKVFSPSCMRTNLVFLVFRYDTTRYSTIWQFKIRVLLTKRLVLSWSF